MNMDSIREKLDYLKAKHRTLDEKIRLWVSTSIPDPIELRQLKKLKLQLKDQIAQLEAQLMGYMPQPTH